MDGRTHRVGGICTGIICAEMLTNLDFSTKETTIQNLVIIGMATIGSLFPDIDTKTSIISKEMRITSFFIRLFTKHRGLMHRMCTYLICTPIFAAIGYGLSALWNMYFTSSIVGLVAIGIFAFLCGVLCHLVFDMLTTEGTPILYPIIKNKISIAKLSGNNSRHRKLVTLLCIITTFLVTIYLHFGSLHILIEWFELIKSYVIDFIETLKNFNTVNIR